MFQDLRRPVVAGDQDIGKRLVVAQLHVEARPQLLDQIGFQQQRLGFGRGRHDLDGGRRRDHARDARRLRRRPAHRTTAACDVLGLADIEHVAGGIEHAVDAGRGGRMAHRVLDRGMAERQPAFRHRFARFVRELPAAAPRRPPRPLMSRGRYPPARGPAAAYRHSRRPAWSRGAPVAGLKPWGCRKNRDPSAEYLSAETVHRQRRGGAGRSQPPPMPIRARTRSVTLS